MKPWTRSEERRLVMLFKYDGKSMAQVGFALGRTEQAVKVRINKLRVNDRRLKAAAFD